MKNYYQILNIPSSAGEEEIKNAYYAMAKKFHPDKNLRNPYYSADKFREVQEAYRVLSDGQEKAIYDQQFIYLYAEKMRHVTRDRRNIRPHNHKNRPQKNGFTSRTPQEHGEKFDMFRNAFLKKQKEIHQQYQQEKIEEQRNQKKNFQEAFKRNQEKLRQDLKEEQAYQKNADDIKKAQKKGKQVITTVVGILIAWLLIIFLILNDFV
ncbi:hypothetical protein BKI52_44620 [marine bacterium AO1-C]|nr:hypothetical protein BKI52_44620 [marine bacterium AO1-C]